MQEKQYVLEWSQKTNNFHIQPLESVLSTNQELFIDNKPSNGWIVIFTGTFEAVTEMADHWRERLIKREKPVNLKHAL